MGVEVALAGQLSIHHGGQGASEETLGIGQAQLVFAVLVKERARAIPRHELAEILWPADLPATWGSALRSVVSKVRAFIAAVGLPADAVVSVGGCYQLRLDDVLVDIEDAERFLQQAVDALADGRPRDAATSGAAALQTLTQPVLPSVDSPWLDTWRDHLGQAAVRAAEVVAEALIVEGDGPGAVTAADYAIARAPYRESAYRLLMRAHELSGNRAEALRAYERCRVMLSEEMGVSPSPETETLYVGLLGTEPDPAAGPAAVARPASTTVTFLFSDIEGSSAMWEQSPDVMSAVLARHDAALREAVERHGGRVFKHTGDGMCAVFSAARDALEAAVDAQREVGDELRVRMGIHTGEAEVRDDDFAGVALNRVGRLCGLANGGQVLVSSSTRLVVEGRLPTGVEMRPLGEVQLRGFAAPESVYQLTHTDLLADFPPINGGERSRHVVVAEDGPLLGRDDELGSVLAAFERSRLVAITGPGGVGKTRLALSAANRVVNADPARVWWVELAAVDAGGVADAIADAVGASGPGVEVMDAVTGVLAAAPAVVVLDNCEHLVGPAGDVTRVLLNACPDLRVLVTSRIPLGLSMEHVVALSPLALDDAVALFTERARAVNPRFALTDQNAADVTEICERLDGLPLAVELAAARVQSIPPAEIVRHLDERLRLLRRSVRDRSGRHRSLEEALRWSFELLTDEEQHVFNRLSVFAGGFTATAAAEVTGVGDTLYLLDVLDGLAERSMVVAAGTENEARYRVLETMAEFGRKELDGAGDTEGVLDAHQRYYVGVAEEAAVALQGPDEARWVERIHGDFADIRAVFGRAIAAGDADTAMRIVVALFDYAFFRMRGEVGHWAVSAMALPGADDHPLYGRTAAVAGYLAWERGAIDDAERFTAIAHAHDGGWVAFDARATIDLFAGRVAEAVANFEAAVEIARRDGNRYREAIALAQVAFAKVFAGSDDAYDVATRAEPIARATGNPTARVFAAWASGVSLYHAPRRALELLEVAMQLGREVDNRMAFGAAATPAEELRTRLGSRTVSSDLEAALEQVEYWMTMGNAPNVWLTMRRVARDVSGLGDHEAAAMAFGAEADAMSKLPMRAGEGDRHQAAVDRTRAALGEDEYDRHAARGAAMPVEDLVAELRRRVREQAGDHEDRRPAP